MLRMELIVRWVRLPSEYIAKIWTSEPERFIVNPIHQMPRLNTYEELVGAAIQRVKKGRWAT